MMDVKGRRIPGDDGSAVKVRLNFSDGDSTTTLYSLIVAVSDADDYDDEDPDSVVYGAYERARDEVLPQLRQALDKASGNA